MAKVKFFESKWFNLFDLWWNEETAVRKIECMAEFYKSRLSKQGQALFNKLIKEN